MTNSLLDDAPYLAVDRNNVTVGLLDGHISDPVEEELPIRKVVQCRMPGDVKLHKMVRYFEEYLLATGS